MTLCLDLISRLRSMSRYLKAGAQSQPPACVVSHLHGVFLFEVAGDKTNVLRCLELPGSAELEVKSALGLTR